MARKKVVFIVPYQFVPARNGGHKAAFGFAEYLAQRTDLLVLSTTNNEPTGQFALIPVFRDIIFKYLNPLVGLKLMIRSTRHKAAFCITHQPFIAIWLMFLKRLFSFQCGVYVQNLEYQRFRSMGRWWWPVLYQIERLVYRKSDFLLFISPDDLAAGVAIFRLDPAKCLTANYGTDRNSPPVDRLIFKNKVRTKHHLPKDDRLFLFFGPQSYQPNLEAVRLIIRQIIPELEAKQVHSYRILICGGGLPEAEQQELARYEQVHYLGFVDHIEDYILAADLVLNPILTGGGVKTKIIEAIALGTSVVSFRTGSLGMNVEACGEKLILVDDNDVNTFAGKMLHLTQMDYSPTPESFYREYHWGAVADQVVTFLSEVR